MKITIEIPDGYQLSSITLVPVIPNTITFAPQPWAPQPYTTPAPVIPYMPLDGTTVCENPAKILPELECTCSDCMEPSLR